MSVRIPPPEHQESETYDILPRVLLHVSTAYDAMAWRENSGLYWAPTAEGWRRVRASTPGCADIIGCVPLSTERLLARGILTIGAFVGFEVKTLTGQARKSQIQFRDNLTRRHGIYTLARAPEYVDREMERWL